MSEIMVKAIEPTVHELGLSDFWVRSVCSWLLLWEMRPSMQRQSLERARTAWTYRSRLRSAQAFKSALLVTPVLVLSSLIFGPRPMDLALSVGLVVTILLSVLITGQIASDGRSDWLKGAQLLVVYLVLALAFFFLPGSSP